MLYVKRNKTDRQTVENKNKARYDTQQIKLLHKFNLTRISVRNLLKKFFSVVFSNKFFKKLRERESEKKPLN